MSDADAFLAAIRANPADDTVRLVFADWLDDHGDPALAEFVRVQIRLGPANRNSPRVAALAARERHLLAAHRADWLGPLAGIDPTDGFAPKFARGFVDAVSAASELLADRSADIARHCPVLRCLDALAVRGVGAALASAACLAPVRTLRLEDWPYPDDAVALAASPCLRRVEELSVWVGSRHDESVVRAFAASPNLPNLRQSRPGQLPVRR